MKNSNSEQVLDTSGLVQNRHQLLNTERTFCWLKYTAAHSLAKSSDMSRLFRTKSNLDHGLEELREILDNDICLVPIRLIGSNFSKPLKEYFILVISRSEGCITFGDLFHLSFVLFKDVSQNVWQIMSCLQRFHGHSFLNFNFFLQQT